ncbi:BTAD domain-containing putative transcriptional regulator [Saccharothrix australiensis]|uniref:DNA-binding SARP family transcriptional activator n=1 Tax=Saccharothrix australiensis TaxID=2072 RepID=A0A495W692_9PSEU|nr:BTAD domain-containing putative transcriptional regulator [Saccharothrix australiensis]RKT55318.1 DNA-binding SARP family transcriptional activator [Saccharothrix australiensis]
MTGSEAPPLSVALLGPVRAWRAGVEVDVGAARRRAVFAVLALRAGRVVSRDELIGGVWGDAPPATADASLYTYVSGLRRVLEPQRSKRSAAGVLVSAGGGYSLRLDPDGLDVDRFERHLTHARELADTDVPRAIAELDRALALWRGDPLDGVPGPFAEAQRARLLELRLATVERRAGLALAVGDHAEVIAGLSDLIAEHPMREGPRALLVTALHRAGRRAEALAAYREAHRVLVDELGLEPGLALRRAHREVVGDEPRDAAVAVGRPRRVEAREVAGIGLVGRRRELVLLRRAVADVAAGRGRGVWVEGEPGAGKSALLAAGLADAVDAGCRVGWSALDELGGHLPLCAVLDCLDLTALSPDRRHEVDLGSLLHADGAAADAVDRLVAFVAELCARGPLVLVVDDLQWADETSVACWQRLLDLTRRLPLLLVTAVRPVPRRADLARVRSAVAGSGGDVVVLGALADDEVTALVTDLVGAPPGEGLRLLVGRTGGNPRYVRGTVDALVRDDLVEFRDGVAELPCGGAGDDLPPSLATAATRWSGFLSPAATEALRWAALLGVRFAVEDAATAAGRPVPDFAAALEEPLAAGVLADTGSGLAFRHPLLRQALYQGMPGPVRNALHRQAAESLAGAGAAVEVVAGQLAAAPAVVDPWVVGWLVDNAHAVERRAPDVAAGLLRTVVDQPAVDPAHRERLAARLADLLFRLGRRPDTEARSVLARARDPELLAGMHSLLLHLRHLDGAAADSAEALRAAIADDGVPAVWRARLAALLAAWSDEAGGTEDDAEEAAWHAVRRAEEVGDDFAAAHAWRSLWWAGSARLDHEEALTRVERGLAVVRGRADLRGWHAALSACRAATLRHLDRLAEADAALRAGRADDPSAGPLRVAATVQDYWLGRWDDAEREAAAAPTGSGPAAHGVAALVAARRGRPEDAREHLRAAAARGPGVATDPDADGFPPPAEAFAAEAAGRLDLATAALEPLLGARRTPTRHQWLPLLTRYALAAGRRDTAACAARVCAEDAAVERVRAGASAAAAHCRGLVDGDPAPVLAAATRYRDVGRPVEEAEALENAGALLAARGDGAGARAACAAALTRYRLLGAVLDVRRAEARLRRTA